MSDPIKPLLLAACRVIDAYAYQALVRPHDKTGPLAPAIVHLRHCVEAILRLPVEIPPDPRMELNRLRLVANDAKAVLDSRDAGSFAALAESVAALEAGEDVDEDDLGK